MATKNRTRDVTATVTALYEISKAINTTKGLDDLYKAIHMSLNKILNLENFAVAIYHKEKDSITLPYFVDERDPNPGEVFDISKKQSLTARVINTGTPLIFKEEEIKNLSTGKVESLIGTVPKVWAGAPLKIRGRSFGAIVAQSYRSKDAFKKNDLELLTSVGEFIVASIERKRAEVARKQSDEINQVLREITSAIHSSENLYQLFETIHQTLGRLWDVSNFYIGLYEKKSNILTFPFFRDEYDDITLLDAVYLKANSLTYTVFQALKPVLLKKPDLDILKAQKSMLGTVPLIWLGIPLMAKTEPIGIMVIQSYSNPGLFDKKDVDILCSVSEQIALAIERKQAEKALRESEEKHRLLYENAVEGIFHSTPDGRYLSVNPSFLRIFGFNSQDELSEHFKDIGKHQYLNPEDRDNFKKTVETQGVIKAFETQLFKKDGTPIWVSMNARAVRDDMGALRYYEGFLQDITERKTAQEELYRISIHDHLTGLCNRRYVFERLDAMVNECQRQVRYFSISIIDLDHFKKINDTHGHQAGDFILREFAAILSGCFRPYDIVGRYGGEEFIVVAMNIDIIETQHMLERFREIIKCHVFDFTGTHIRITFSAGVANTGETGSEITVENLIRKADERLYLAKEKGRDKILINS